MIDQSIFQSLQSKIDQESSIRDALTEIVHSLNRKERLTQATLSRVHFTPRKDITPLLQSTTTHLLAQRDDDLAHLSRLASTHPFYLYNHIWTRELQELVYQVLLCAWLKGYIEEEGEEDKEEKSAGEGNFLSIEQVGKFLNIPVNVKGCDTFHLTIEEYLFAVISLVDELSRLAVNSVTLGDYTRPLQISKFIGEIHAGLQTLNLKNGPLRVRSDGVKYAVKRVEGVVYDLSLRKLIPTKEEEEEEKKKKKEVTMKE